MDRVKKSILKTLIYSDIFDYPLTYKQIYQFLLSPSVTTHTVVKTALEQLTTVQRKGKYFFLVNRENVVTLRKKKEVESRKKRQKALSVAFLLSTIPTVFFIGISGGVAIGNADIHDDIDLFVIVKKNTVWVTRLLLLFLLEISGNRRRRNQSNTADTICLNMIIDESTLSFPRERQEVYTAHEIVQVIPLYDRYDTYKRFLQANTWVRKLLPHAYIYETTYKKITSSSVWESILVRFCSLWIVEYSARKVQERIMQSHRTSEYISATALAFHPLDYREKTLLEYKKRIKKYV